MFKRLLVLSLLCMFSAHAMDTDGANKTISRDELIQELWRAKENQTPPPSLTLSLQDLSKYAMDTDDAVLFNSCAQHLSPRALEELSRRCVRQIPNRILARNAQPLTQMLTTITALRQKPENQSSE